MNLIIENCLHCGKHDTRFGHDKKYKGCIFQFDLCVSCDDIVSRLLTSIEAQDSLMRIVDLNTDRMMK